MTTMYKRRTSNVSQIIKWRRKLPPFMCVVS